MKRIIPFVMILVLISSCAAPAAITPATATPDQNQETINTIIQVAQSVTAEQADQAELDLLNLQREQSGARANFGDQADAIFLQMDQSRAAALDKMVNAATGAITSPLKVSALITKPGTSGTTRASPLETRNYLTKSMVQAFMSLLLATQISNPNNETAIGDITEGGDPIGAAGTHYSFQPLLFGSRLEATGTVTTTETTPFPYTEAITYDLSMEVCPDANGNVPIHLTLHSTASLLGGGVQFGVDGQVTGHVNDDSELASTASGKTWERPTIFSSSRKISRYSQTQTIQIQVPRALPGNPLIRIRNLIKTLSTKCVS
jgi:hypothetical protein